MCIRDSISHLAVGTNSASRRSQPPAGCLAPRCLVFVRLGPRCPPRGVLRPLGCPLAAGTGSCRVAEGCARRPSADRRRTLWPVMVCAPPPVGPGPCGSCLAMLASARCLLAPVPWPPPRWVGAFAAPVGRSGVCAGGASGPWALAPPRPQPSTGVCLVASCPLRCVPAPSAAWRPASSRVPVGSRYR